jgi:hypothetical protein
MDPSPAVQAAPVSLQITMTNGSKVLLAIAAFIVLALAAAIHLLGPSLGRALHGGR